MSEFKGTPGEWFVDPDWAHDVQVFVGGRTLEVCTVEPETLIGGEPVRDCQQLKANARLIAAAPELLQAAQDIKLCGLDDVDGSGWGVIHCRAEDWDALCKSIAKALGEDQ